MAKELTITLSEAEWLEAAVLLLEGGGRKTKAFKVLNAALTMAAPKENDWYATRIGARKECAYGSPECKGIRFAPNGVGSRQHTTCAQGRAALAAR